MTVTVSQRIGWREFGHQISRIGALQDALQHSARLRIAVGVSGGADSMALAYLLQNFMHPKDHKRKAFDVYSFIVDHGVRKGSRDEAFLVKRNLDELGIRSEILSIKWPTWPLGLNPAMDSAFEENARHARYDLILRTALRHSCSALFTGHHLDDNIETLLFRLARNKQHPLHSLCGIREKSLPPCEHTFGVHGYTETSEVRYSKPEAQYLSRSNIIVRERAYKGLNLYRPLLSFPKSRILATCTSYNIPYVDDKTNHDPMFATRNAIRHMRQFDLPKALQAPRLLALQGRAENFLNDIEDSAKTLSQRISKLHVYTQTGAMVVEAEIPLTAVNDHDWQYLMARIIEFVAPQIGTSFPALLPSLKMQEILHMDESATVAPIMFRKVMIHARRTVQSDVVSLHMILHRQTLSKQEVERSCLPFRLDTSSAIDPSTQVLSEYVLWDERFWIRISCPNEDTMSKMSIRAYQVEDVQRVKNAVSAQKRYREFDNAMRISTPSETSQFRAARKDSMFKLMRNTLPVLVYDDQVVAFPTLNFSVQKELVPQLSWQVKYRRADRVLDFFAPHFLEAHSNSSSARHRDAKKGRDEAR